MHWFASFFSINCYFSSLLFTVFSLSTFVGISICVSLLSPPSCADIAWIRARIRVHSGHDCRSIIRAIANNWNGFGCRCIYPGRLHNCGTSHPFHRQHFLCSPPTSPVSSAMAVSDPRRHWCNFLHRHTKRPARPVCTQWYESNEEFVPHICDSDDDGHNSTLQCRRRQYLRRNSQLVLSSSFLTEMMPMPSQSDWSCRRTQNKPQTFFENFVLTHQFLRFEWKMNCLRIEFNECNGKYSITIIRITSYTLISRFPNWFCTCNFCTVFGLIYKKENSYSDRIKWENRKKENNSFRLFWLNVERES